MNAAVGKAIRLLVRSPARQVLLARELRLRNGGTRRWLTADFPTFMRDFRLEVAHLRPTAEQQTLPTKGSRLMVDFALATTAADGCERFELRHVA